MQEIQALFSGENSAKDASILKRQATGELHIELPWLGLLEILSGSRLVNRVLLTCIDQEFASTSELMTAIQKYPWAMHYDGQIPLWIEATARKNPALRNDMHLAQLVKDQICDQLRDKFQRRPDIEKSPESLRLQARLVKNRFWLGVDLGGGPLHERGYRKEQGMAPLRETTAAAILWYSGWRWGAETCEYEGLFDPTCGSGTILIEGLLARLGYEPGLSRNYEPWKAWSSFPKVEWLDLLRMKRERADKNREEFCLRQQELGEGSFFGADIDRQVLSAASRNAERAGVEELLSFHNLSVHDLDRAKFLSTKLKQRPILVIANPPYGERMGSEKDVLALLKELGERTANEWPAWGLSLLCGEKDQGFALPLRRPKRRRIYNGPLACELLYFPPGENRSKSIVDSNSQPRLGSEEFLAVKNRLDRRKKHLQKWAKREGIEAYRVYDADMTEFRFKADLYADIGIVVQEYAPPKTVDPDRAARRRREFLSAVAEVYELPQEKIFFRSRMQQKGKSQYRKRRELAPRGARINWRSYPIIRENGLKFIVNLEEYLDTGLFLDHRPLRKLLLSEARKKSVLNLFCYTGSLSVAAARGGAKSVVSVDLSKRYCEWMEQNFRLNKITCPHRIVNGDVLEFLQSGARGELYDLILFDPPTFSNSKRTQTVFDVQRDHIEVIKLLKDRLNPSGQIYFSTNARKFRLDGEGLKKIGLSAEERTRLSVPDDFRKEPPPHRSWLVC